MAAPRRRLTAALALGAATARPQAPPLLFAVPAFSDGGVLLPLPGFDASGRPLFTTIATLPANGTLWQLASVFSAHGVSPPAGQPITAPGTRVSGSGARVVYTPPRGPPPAGAWARFTYTVSDGVTASPPGPVALVPHHRRLAASTFDDGPEGWAVVGNGARAAAAPGGGIAHEPFARGPALSRYVVATDEEVVLAAGAAGAAAAAPVDARLWRFAAPPAFAGDFSPALGGSLEFAVGAFAGDFAQLTGAAPGAAPQPLVTLECAACGPPGGPGVRLGAFPSAAYAPEARPRRVSLPLAPAAWRHDPRNALLPWAPVAQCELAAVLAGLTGLHVLGDLTLGVETVALDDVAIVAPPGPAVFPRDCVL